MKMSSRLTAPAGSAGSGISGIAIPAGHGYPTPAIKKQASQISEEWAARYLDLKEQGRQVFAHYPAHASLNIHPSGPRSASTVGAKNRLFVLHLKMSASRITRTHAAAVALPKINQPG